MTQFTMPEYHNTSSALHSLTDAIHHRLSTGGSLPKETIASHAQRIGEMHFAQHTAGRMYGASPGSVHTQMVASAVSNTTHQSLHDHATEAAHSVGIYNDHPHFGHFVNNFKEGWKEGAAAHGFGSKTRHLNNSPATPVMETPFAHTRKAASATRVAAARSFVVPMSRRGSTSHATLGEMQDAGDHKLLSLMARSDHPQHQEMATHAQVLLGMKVGKPRMAKGQSASPLTKALADYTSLIKSLAASIL